MKLSDIKKSLLNFLGLNVLTFIVNLLVKTYRFDFRNKENFERVTAESKKFISAFWHGRMLIPWYIHRKYKIAALVSKSKDGEILTRLLKNWNYQVVRGSSHIGGKDALKIMEAELDEGFSFAITPDGPTGPRHKMKPGAVVLAHRKNVPLFLIGTGSSKHFVFKSWDKFQVPKPFSKVAVVYSNPIYVRQESTRGEINNLIEVCEAELMKLQKDAESIVGNDT